MIYAPSNHSRSIGRATAIITLLTITLPAFAQRDTFPLWNGERWRAVKNPNLSKVVKDDGNTVFSGTWSPEGRSRTNPVIDWGRGDGIRLTNWEAIAFRARADKDNAAFIFEIRSWAERRGRPYMTYPVTKLTTQWKDFVIPLTKFKNPYTLADHAVFSPPNGIYNKSFERFTLYLDDLRLLKGVDYKNAAQESTSTPQPKSINPFQFNDDGTVTLQIDKDDNFLPLLIYQNETPDTMTFNKLTIENKKMRVHPVEIPKEYLQPKNAKSPNKN